MSKDLSQHLQHYQLFGRLILAKNMASTKDVYQMHNKLILATTTDNTGCYVSVSV